MPGGVFGYASTMGTQTVAVLGAGGTMGRGIARNIKKAGFDVRAWNRSRAKAEPLSADGITVVDSPADALDGADFMLTILADGDAVVEVAQQALRSASPDLAWLQMSTIGHEATDRCRRIADETGLTFVDAPVLGTKQPAEEGKLVVLASGPDDVRDRVQPIFDAVGQRTLWVGEAGKGSRLKLAINVWLVGVVEAAAESLGLAENLGVDPGLVIKAVEGGPLDMPYLHVKGEMMIRRHFEPSFRLALAAKDARLAAKAAADAGVDLPLVETIAERFTAAAQERGDEDLAATFLTIAEPARRAAA